MTEMKDSGVTWLGEIPKEWNVVRIKHPLKERKENNKPIKTSQILSLTNDRGVILYEDKGDIGNKSKENLEDYKLAYPNDIVLNSMNIIIGSVGLSKYFGAVSPVYYMLNKRFENDSIEYLNYVFQTREFQRSLLGYGNGILAHRMRIQMQKLNTVMIPYPSPEVQRKIALFLDKKTETIDTIILNTKKSITEYKKYKQSLITEVITKGLDSKVNMKKSGIPWIGDIPEHWQIVRIKNVLFPQQKNVLETDGIVTCYRSGEVTLRTNKRSEGYTVSNTENGYQGVDDGDIVIHGMDAFGGAIGISDSRGKCTPVYHVCNTNQNEEYIVNYLRVLAMNDVLMALSSGVRIRSSDYRNWNKLAVIPIIIPPYDEQCKIVNHINDKINEINSFLRRKEILLTELESYKKSLIYETVTGKKVI